MITSPDNTTGTNREMITTSTPTTTSAQAKKYPTAQEQPHQTGTPVPEDEKSIMDILKEKESQGPKDGHNPNTDNITVIVAATASATAIAIMLTCGIFHGCQALKRRTYAAQMNDSQQSGNPRYSKDMEAQPHNQQPTGQSFQNPHAQDPTPATLQIQPEHITHANREITHEIKI